MIRLIDDGKGNGKGHDYSTSPPDFGRLNLMSRFAAVYVRELLKEAQGVWKAYITTCTCTYVHYPFPTELCLQP